MAIRLASCHSGPMMAGLAGMRERAAGIEVPVDLALVLALDCSGSLNEGRLAMQIEGCAAALRSQDLLRAVASLHHRRIAVACIAWSSFDRQDYLGRWAVVEDQASANAFAQAILAAFHPIPGYTSISGAIDFCTRLLAGSGLKTDRQVIDISGDGSNNDGRDVALARDEAVAAGITINGLPILELEPTLDAYFRTSVIGGAGAFVSVARTASDYTPAMQRKLLTEVAGIGGATPPL